MLDSDWSSFWIETNPNISWDIMKGIFIECLNECAPFIELNNVKATEKWVDADLLNLIRERDILKEKLDTS